MDAAFGGNLNTDLTTPQGQMAVTQTAIIGNKNDELLALFNGFDPLFADGRQQDALARLWFLERDPARPTVVTATLTGAVGTPIPAGSLAQATDGNLYGSISDVSIGAGGTVNTDFQCATAGPIACPAGSLTKVYKAISGWDTITNAADGALGNDTETRQAFETRREQSRAINARAILDAVQGAVLAVPNVLDAYTTENVLSTPQTVGGYTLAPNSLYVAVTGGDAAAIARAIWTKKPPGCNYNGTTTVTVSDDNAGYVVPVPTYDVSFVRPTPTAVKIAVTIPAGSTVPGNYVAQIRAAILNAFAGGDGGTRARIASTLYALRYYAPVNALGAWAQVVSLKIGFATADQDVISMHIDQNPTLAAGDISVTAV